MLVVLNGSWGGFYLPVEIESEDQFDDSMEMRTSDVLINWVQENPYETSLYIAEMPSEATDYRIEDYDGVETLWYVLDGKMHRAKEIQN